MKDIFGHCDRLTMTELAQKMGVSISAVWRWRQRGIGGHRLETVKIGGRRYVFPSHLDRFMEALNGKKATTESSTVSTDERSEITDHELDRILRTK